MWDTVKDEFVFDFEAVIKVAREVPTKRDLLSIIASLFDPLGLLSPCIVKLKVIFQNATKDTKGWGEILNEEIQKEWTKWFASVREFKEIRIQRPYFDARIMNIMLVGFGDDSENAYAAVIYAVCTDYEGNRASSFVICKTRVTPIKTQCQDLNC